MNNAGGNSFMSPLESMRFTGWQKAFVLNVDSTVRLIQAALPSMIAGGHGSIVNVSSVTGLRGSPLMSHYGAAKAAVVSLTQSLGVELGERGVRANALVPGWVETDLTGFLRTDGGVEDVLLSRVPMRRWGTPEEIAQGALFLASDASSFMTGQVLDPRRRPQRQPLIPLSPRLRAQAPRRRPRPPAAAPGRSSRRTRIATTTARRPRTPAVPPQPPPAETSR